MKDNSEVSVEVKLMKLEIISIIWSYDTIYRTKVSWSIVQKYLGYDDWKCLATFSFLRGSCLFTVEQVSYYFVDTTAKAHVPWMPD